ncbi:MAG: hypothetical protein ACLFTJ_02480 [Halothece sp.]
MPAKKLSEGFLANQYKQKGEEPLSERSTLRLTPSLKARMEKFKQEHGRLPSDEIRQFLDEILPEL